MYMVARFFILVILANILYHNFRVDYIFIDSSMFFYKILMIGFLFSLLFFLFNIKSDLKILKEIKGEVVTTAHYVEPILRTMSFSVFLYASVLLYFLFANFNEIYSEEVSNIYVEVIDGTPIIVESNDIEMPQNYHKVYKGIFGDLYYYH
ncbi:hypothetical protein [Vibrio aestuarianus]|uniref:Uncharacterized protein n=1 Tax=Vibrio aestuarianus TaxID=28171 RepID=A0A9X4IUR1_9VIBR|nr:hypothetical protein [Vibrio aestuarianus]MDE1243540.1 hypothetical protein [Vibrio aestuarianus]